MISPCYNSSCSEKKVNWKERVAAQLHFYITLLYSSNGWLQLELRITSISLKTGMIANAYFKETQHLWKILDHCKWPPEIMAVRRKYLAASALLKLQYPLNRSICQVHCIYTIHGCKCSSKINAVSIKDGNYFREIKKKFTLCWPISLIRNNQCESE